MSTDGEREREQLLDEIMGYVLDATQAGATLDMKDIQQRFPCVSDDIRLARELESLLSMHGCFQAPLENTPKAEGETEPQRDLGQKPISRPKWGGFLLIDELGQGGMGEVYKAWDISAQRFVALKRLQPLLRNDEVACRRFRDEPRHMQGLSHPGIVRVLDVGEVDGHPYFTMEIVDGTNLSMLARNQALPHRKIAELMREIAEAVAFAHQAGILHRDLKPANVLLTPDLRPKLADFGLAKNLEENSDLTRSFVLGTLNYMAPEQAAGQLATEQTDVYGLGAILYELLTARPPFRGESPPQILLQLQTEDVAAPRRVSADADQRLEAICLKCLEKDRRLRYQTVAAVVEEFDRVLGGRRQLAPRYTRLRRAAKLARRHPAAASLAVVSLAAVISVISLVSLNFVQRGRTRTAEAEAQAARLEGQAVDLKARLAVAKAESQAGAVALEKTAVGFMQQGRWEEAIRQLDAAMESGHPEPERLRMERARCWLILGAAKKADEEFAALLADDLTPGPLRTEVLIRRGSLLLIQDPQVAVKLLRDAKESGHIHDTAEREYLEGLLAEHLSSAAEHFAAAVQQKPYHVEARRMLVVCLFFLGRLPEVHQQAQICAAFLPQDVGLQLLEAVCYIIEGKDADAEKILQNYQGDTTDAAVAAIKALMPLVRDFRDPDRWAETNWTIRAVQISSVLLRLQSAFQQISGDSHPQIPMPPQIRTSYGPLVMQLVGKLTFGRTQDFAQILEQLTEHHHEGSLYYALGQAYLKLGQFDQAERALLAAEAAPSLFDVRPRAQWWLARVKWQRSLDLPEQREQYQTEALACLRRLMASEKLPTIPKSEIYQLSELALDCKDYVLAAQVTDAWQRLHPDDPDAHQMRGVIEMHQGHYCAALSRYDQAKAMGSEHGLLDPYIQSAREGLLQRAAELDAPAKR